MANDKRVNPGIPSGGQFAAHDRADSLVSLPTAPAVVVTVDSTIVLNGYADETVAYPDGLGEPKISFTYGDDHPGVLYTTVEATDVNGAEGSITVWADEDGDRGDSIENSGEPTGWDGTIDDEIIEWAHNLSERINQSSTRISEEVLSQAAPAIIANALGKAYVDPNAIDYDGLISEVSTARASKFLALWGDLPSDADSDDRVQAVQDVLIDLRHFAFTHEIDFRSLADDSYNIHMADRADDEI